MTAVQSLLNARDDGHLEIVTSRETHREQDRTKDPTVRAQLAESRGETPVVPNDHKLLGFHNQMNHLGTVAVTPMLTEIVDEALFKNLPAAGLDVAVYAACNECDRFVTTDPHFTSMRTELEALCPDLKIVTPSELAAELSIPRATSAGART
jgi:predicted nucleic acid-binding protein